MMYDPLPPLDNKAAYEKPARCVCVRACMRVCMGCVVYSVCVCACVHACVRACRLILSGRINSTCSKHKCLGGT